MLKWLIKKLTPLKYLGYSLESYSGAGKICCNSCGHSEHIHIFTHGFGPKSDCTMGYQCQSCAKLVTFDSEPIGEAGLIGLKAWAERSLCDCAGKFARDQPIMYPQRRSAGVEYELAKIT